MTTVEPIYPNREAIGRCLHTYLDGMCPFVVLHLKRKRGSTVVDSIRESLSGGQRLDDFERRLAERGGQVELALDFGIVRTIVDRQWRDVFRDAFRGDQTVRSAIHCITETRNREDAHLGAGDTEATIVLAFIEHTITVLRYLNYPQGLERVSQERDAVLERCIAAYQQNNQPPNFRENISRAAELEAIATQADERLQQANAALALLQGVIGLERVSAERVAAVAAHEAAVAEHEAAVAEHEAAVIALKEAIDRLDAARNDSEFSEAELAICQAEERAAAALEREKAADAEEARSDSLEAEANLHYALADDYGLATLSEAEEVVAEALRQAEVHGAELIEIVQEAKERKEAAEAALKLAIEREQDADRREGLADAREAGATERASASKELPGEIRERPGLQPHSLPDNLPEVWKEITYSLRLDKGWQYNLGALLKDCPANDLRVSADGRGLMLHCKSNLLGKRLTDELAHPEVREKVESAIERIFGRRYFIKVIRP